MKRKLLVTLFLSIFAISCSGNKKETSSTTEGNKAASIQNQVKKDGKKGTAGTQQGKKADVKTRQTGKNPAATKKLAAATKTAPAAPAVPAAKVAELVKKAMAKPHPRVKMETSMGTIIIELDTKKAPVSSKNFLTYAAEGFYNGTIFHRVIGTFMIQGGGFTSSKNFMKKTKGLHGPIKNEAGNGLTNDRGTIAMARTKVIDSAQAQFFINVVDNKFLNHRSEDIRGFGYAVFGKVVKGMDVVDKIKSVPTTNKGGPFANAPVNDVIIKSVVILP